MATVLSPGDIAIIHYNSTGSDAFSFVFLRAVEAGTIVNFTDNGWQAAGGFRPGEGTVTFTAPAAIAAGTIVTLTGLDLDAAGDQIIAYQGDPATPTILHVIDFADGNNTVAGDATDGNTTALPPGFTLGVNAVTVAFDNSIYAGPIQGSRAELFVLGNNPANWLDSVALPPPEIRIRDRPVVDLDADDSSTHGGRDYRTEVLSGGPGVPVADADIDITDLDGAEITQAEIKVNNSDPGDLLSVNAALLPAGITASTYDPTTGILRLIGIASHADYENAIRLVEFSTTGGGIGDQKRIEVIANDGEEWGPEAKAFITVGSVAAPPVLDLDANNSSGGGADATATFTNGGPAIPIADTDVTITDADSAAMVSATITLGINRQVEDVLSFTGPAGPITAAYDSAAGILTLTGSATLAEYQTALRQVVFSTTSTFTADRLIEVTVNDGTLDSNVATMFMHVAAAPPNVAPALDLDANNSTIQGVNYLTGFTESNPPSPPTPVAIVDTDVSIIDSDSPTLASATITLTNSQASDSLTFNGPAPGSIAVSGSGTSVITLTGVSSQADYLAALQQIQFSNTATDPSNVTRVINIVVNDGASNSNTATAFVQVEDLPDLSPVVDLDPNDSGGSLRTTFRNAFTENGAPVPIADVDTSITDDGDTIVSATIALTNRQTGDLLAVSGTLPGLITTAGYDPGTGILTLTGSGTRAEYQAALQQILYSNTGDDPITEDRLIEVVVNDGTNDSNVAAAVISVTATDDAPVIAVDPSAAYVENAAAVVLAPLTILSDVDDTDLNGALVRITAGSFPGDGDILTVGGDPSGTGITFTWDPSQHALVFTGASSVANYQALLQTVAFESTSDNPTDFNASPQRTLTWSVSDGTAVTTATTTIDIVAVNDAPQETVAATNAYTEDGPPLVISPAAVASDVDDLNLVEGGVRIVAGAFDGDILTVNGLQSGTFSGIDFAYDPSSRTLLFSRSASVADYQALMQAIEFESTSDNPTNFGANLTRTLGWGLHDGDDYSSPAQFTEIVITAIDDPAVAQDDAVATTENAVAAGNVLNDFGIDSDPDGGAFLVTAVSGGTVGTQFALASGALLTLNTDGTFSYDPNQLFDYLPAPGSGASNLTVTDTFTYTITGGDTAAVTLTVGGVDTNDVLHDSAGIDSLAGGIGDDVYYVSNTDDGVTEAANAGFDTVAAFVDYTLPASNTVEVLNMLGAGLTGTGSDGADAFISSNGPNILVGLGGNDTYYVNSATDEVIEAAGGGIDTVQATVDYTLPTDGNVEGLYMLGSGLIGTGSDHADSLLSSGGPNTLRGLGGDDLYYINNVDDEVIEAENGGYDTVMASVSYALPANVEALYMNGSGLTGTGSDGADTLVTLGANTLEGDDGNDMFVFFSGSTNGATVADFDRSESDVLVFSGFGTEAQGAALTQMIGTTDQWQIHSGLGVPDETITLSNHAAVQAGDFVFV